MYLSKHTVVLLIALTSTLASLSFAMEDRRDHQSDQIRVADVKSHLPIFLEKDRKFVESVMSYLSQFSDEHVLSTVGELELVLGDIVSLIKGWTINVDDLMRPFEYKGDLGSRKNLRKYEEHFGIDPGIYGSTSKQRGKVKENIEKIESAFKSGVDGSKKSLELFEAYYFADSEIEPAFIWVCLFRIFPQDYKHSIEQKDASYKQFDDAIKASNEKYDKKRSLEETLVYQLFMTRDANFHASANLLSKFFKIPLRDDSLLTWLTGLFYEVKSWISKDVTDEDRSKKQAEKRKARRQRKKEVAKTRFAQSATPEKGVTDEGRPKNASQRFENSPNAKTVVEHFGEDNVQKPSGNLKSLYRRIPSEKEKTTGQARQPDHSRNPHEVETDYTPNLSDIAPTRLFLRKDAINVYDQLKDGTYSETVTPNQYVNLIANMVVNNRHIFKSGKMHRDNVQATFTFDTVALGTVTYAVHIASKPHIPMGYRPRYFGLFRLVLQLDTKEVDIVDVREKKEH